MRALLVPGLILLAAMLLGGCTAPGGEGAAGSADGTPGNGAAESGTGTGSEGTGTAGTGSPGGRAGGGEQAGGGPAQPTISGCGPVQPWDRDGDGISDSVEENNAREGYLPLDPNVCNQDPTRPEGTYYAGALESGANLTDRGAGYVHNRGGDPVDSDDWGSLELIRCIEAAGRAWEGSELVLGVNDLSRRPGKRFSPHRSHQNGLDADLRYVRRDGKNNPLDIRRNPELYDAVATQELLRRLLDQCPVEMIFVDVEHLGFGNEELGAEGEVLRYAPGHSNHFHLRLAPPGG